MEGTKKYHAITTSIAKLQLAKYNIFRKCAKLFSFVIMCYFYYLLTIINLYSP